jgi:chemotaxis protein methyltransferase CheR
VLTESPRASSPSPVGQGASANVAESSSKLEALEIELLAEAVFRHYGYDFREYAPSCLRRRLSTLIRAEGLATVSGLQERILHDPACLQRVLSALLVNATALFRDPDVFLAFRYQVVPLLRTYPYVRIWHAGCSSGEEVYSMAILLEEEGLYDRCRIYATDMSTAALEPAREGVYPLAAVKGYAGNYTAAGGKCALSDYYTVCSGKAVFRSALKRNILFSHHNLTVDQSFNEFNVILCRNVLIYFKRSLQQRVHQLLYDSLAPFGVLGLGSSENLQYTRHQNDYEPLEPQCKLYRRIG